METSLTSAAGATILSSSSAVFGRRRRWILISNKTNRCKYTLKRGIEDRFPLFNEFSERTGTLVSRTSSASMNKMISSRYGGRNSNINKIYKRLESCLVIPPPRGKPPRAIVQFLGGAFIGAIPEVTYGFFFPFRFSIVLVDFSCSSSSSYFSVLSTCILIQLLN